VGNKQQATFPGAHYSTMTEPTVNTPTTIQRGKIQFAILAAVLFIYLLTVFIPTNVSQPGGDLDSGWIRALHWAHLHNFDFGHDIAFTYGPWGFATQAEEPQTFGWSWTIFAFFALVTLAGAIQLSAALSKNIWVRGCFLGGFVLLAGGPAWQMVDARMFEIGWLLLILHFYVNDRSWGWTKVLLTIALAWASLTKFSIGLMALVAIGCITLEQLRRRRLPSYFVVFAASYFFWWLAAGQKLSSLIPYLHHGIQITSGYGQGEGLADSDEQFSIDLVLIISGLLVVAAGSLYPWKKSKRKPSSVIEEIAGAGEKTVTPASQAILGAAGIAGALWIVFKAGYVRHDTHELVASTSVAMIAWSLGAALWNKVNSLHIQLLILFTFCCSLYFVGISIDKYNTAGVAVFVNDQITSAPSNLATVLGALGDNKTVNDQYAGDMQLLRDLPMPAVDGTVDVYSTGQGIVIAKGMAYQPRPVIQSYVAYTSALSKLNADFLTSERAPQNIVFRIETMDNHYPSEEDAASWPEILSRYELKDASQGWLLFRRLSQSRSYTIEPIQTATAEMNKWISVPDSDDPIWVSIDVQSTLEGKLVDEAFRPTDVMLDVRTADGVATTFKLLPDVARGGFLLSPLVTDNLSMAMLNSPGWKRVMDNQRVVELQVRVKVADGTNDEYETQYSVGFSRLRLPHYDVSAVPGLQDYVRARDLQKQLHVVFSEGTPELVSVNSSQSAVLAIPKTQLQIDVPAGAQSVHLGYGMLDRSFTGDQKTAGVAFGAAGAFPTPDGQQHLKILWETKLDPVNSTNDRGIQSIDVSLPNPPPPILVLETVGQGSKFGNYSYWSDVRFK
jgi:hypothetical protein